MEDAVSDEDLANERLAQSLVSDALQGFEGLLSPQARADIHNYLVDELVCTSYGRARLKRLQSLSASAAAHDIVSTHPMLSKVESEAGKP